MCIALGKGGSCSFNSRASGSPRILVFCFLYLTLGLFKVSRGESFFSSFLFFLFLLSFLILVALEPGFKFMASLLCR